MGLSHQTAHNLINVCVTHAAAGKEFQPFERQSEVINDFDCAFVPVSLKYYKDYLGYAVWFYRSLSSPFPAAQLVWPDKAGKLPWETGYDRKFLTRQTILCETPEPGAAPT